MKLTDSPLTPTSLTSQFRSCFRERRREKQRGEVEKDVRVGKRERERERGLLRLGQCVGPSILAFLVENITTCWVPNRLSEIFRHY